MKFLNFHPRWWKGLLYKKSIRSYPKETSRARKRRRAAKENWVERVETIHNENGRKEKDFNNDGKREPRGRYNTSGRRKVDGKGLRYRKMEYSYSSHFSCKKVRCHPYTGMRAKKYLAANMTCITHVCYMWGVVCWPGNFNAFQHAEMLMLKE